MTAPFRRRWRGAGRASTTANLELLDSDQVLVGPFGDYTRLPRSRQPRRESES